MKFCYVMTEEDAAPMTSVALLHEGIGAFDSVFAEIGANYKDISEKGFFAERAYMERNSKFKQIIPCFIIRDMEAKKTILYQRKPTHTEERLAGLWTPIFGGHIDPCDDKYFDTEPLPEEQEMADGQYIPGIIYAALKREMAEETGMEFEAINTSFDGFLYDPSNDVGSVHLGVVFTYYTEITEELVKQIGELPEIHKVIVVDDHAMEELLEATEINLESWAEIVINYYVTMIDAADPDE